MNYRFLRTLGLGVGSALIAMVVFPLIAKAAEPLIKSVIRSGLNLKEQIKGSDSENKEKKD